MPPDLVSCGRFMIDPAVWELCREGERIALGPQPVRLLHLLVSRRGQLVTRQEIYGLLWPAGGVDVNRATNACIRQIRRAIGDHAGHGSLIQSLPGRGYRYREPVPSPAEAAAPQGRPGARRRWMLLGGLAACVAGTLTVTVLVPRSRHPSATITIAIQPFGTTGPGSAESLDAWVAADLTTVLARMSPLRLRVLARGAATGEGKRPDYLLRWTQRRDSVSQVLTAELIRTRDRATLWADRFERSLTNGLVFPREMAERIARAVAPEVLPELHFAWSREPAPAARDAYLRAGYFVRQGRELRLALTYLDTVRARDPGFVPGHSLRADALFLLRAYAGARVAAATALRLDSTDAHAHFILGNLRLITDWSWSAAETELRRAIDLSPGTALYHLGYGYFLSVAGRGEEAVREAELAVALDPLAPGLLAEAGTVFLLSGDFSRAIRSCDQALELDRSARYAGYCASEAHALAGRIDPNMLDRFARASGADPGALFANTGRGFAPRIRRLREWRLAQLEARARLSPDSVGGHGWYDLAVAYAEVGRPEEALRALQRSAGERALGFVAMRVDPRFRALRADHRFQVLERQLGGTECGWKSGLDWRCPQAESAVPRPAARPATPGAG